MKRIKSFIITAITAILGLSSINLAPALATSVPGNVANISAGGTTISVAASTATTFGAEAAILTKCAERESNSQNGDGINCILELVVSVMTIGIGILAVIGIVISGIQYITAGGSEEQTRKAKRRIFEIVLGLAVYAVSYLLLQFFLPGFSGVPGA